MNAYKIKSMNRSSHIPKYFSGIGGWDWRTREAEKWARRQTEKGFLFYLFLNTLNYNAKRHLNSEPAPF